MIRRCWFVVMALGAMPAQHVLCAPSTYPQLTAARYQSSTPPPAAAHKPDIISGLIDGTRLPKGLRVLSAARDGRGRIWLVTDRGAYRSAGSEYEPFTAPMFSQATHALLPPDTKVAGVASDSLGHIWAATNHGLFITDGGDWWSSLDRQDGMPYDILNCVHVASNGDVWGGTPEGAWRLRAGRWRYFWGKRWLPGNVVSDIWSDASGKVWLQTDGGVACIEERSLTLAEKAAHYDKILQERHSRRGYIANVRLLVPGEPSEGHVFTPADSEGIRTGVYVAAMSLRYAATHDPQARAEARRSMHAMLDMERLSGIPGYPARALITEDEIKAGMQGWNPDSPIHGEGKNGRYWVRSPVDPRVWCKTDTSSDSMEGHFFAWFCYYEYAADASERERIRAVVRRAAEHIVNHDFTLVGHTGFKTRWGVWGPQYLNDDPAWFSQRGLNSVELLSHMKIAYHITGDHRYQAIFEGLIKTYHYLQNTLLHRRGANGVWWDINHGDDQLAFMAYYPLLTLERDPASRCILIESLARTWEPAGAGGITIEQEHDSFFNFAYGAMTRSPCEPEQAIIELQDCPWDLVDWTVKNSQRHDVRLLTRSGDVRSKLRIDRVLSSAELPLRRLIDDPWRPDDAGEGHTEYEPGHWLLGYWLGVYHGYISQDR